MRTNILLGVVVLGSLATMFFTVRTSSSPHQAETAIPSKTWQGLALEPFPIRRLAVPSGWLVATAGEQKGIHAPVFVPDFDYGWRNDQAAWERLVIDGVHLYRLKVPSGWLVRGDEPASDSGPSAVMAFIPDRRHGWSP